MPTFIPVRFDIFPCVAVKSLLGVFSKTGLWSSTSGGVAGMLTTSNPSSCSPYDLSYGSSNGLVLIPLLEVRRDLFAE